MAVENLDYNTGKAVKSHAVGNYATSHYTTIPHGLVADTDLENYTIGEVYFDEKGERRIKVASLETKAADSVLIANIDRFPLNFGNFPGIDAYYIGKGERARGLHLLTGGQFQTSAYAEGLKNGDVVAFDGTKYVKSDDEVSAKFIVVVDEASAYYSTLGGKKTIILEVK